MKVLHTTSELLKIFPNAQVFARVQEMTKEQMLDDPMKEYNASIWRGTVERYAKYPECSFYKLPADEVYSYDRFYAIYIADGIRFMNRVAYGSCLSNGGFMSILISADLDIITNKFESNGQVGYLKNCEQSRTYMRSRVETTTFANSL